MHRVGRRDLRLVVDLYNRRSIVDFITVADTVSAVKIQAYFS